MCTTSLYAYAKAFNERIMSNHKIEVDNVMTYSILTARINQSLEWQKLIERYPEIQIYSSNGPGPGPGPECGRWCQDPTLCIVKFPKDINWRWSWNETIHNLELYREEMMVFSHYYGLLKYDN